MQRFRERLRRTITNAPARLWAVTLLTGLFALCVGALALMLNVVTITDSNGERRVVFSAVNTPKTLLYLTNIETNEADGLYYTAYNGNLATLNIQRAFEVDIASDGEKQIVMMNAGTVGEAIEKAGIVLGEHDYTVPGLYTPVIAGTNIEVHRVEYRDTVHEEAVVSPVVYKETPLLKAGNTRTWIIEQGRGGLNEVTYRERVVDGEVESALTVTTIEKIKATRTVILKHGTGTVSRIKDVAGIEIAANAPSSYKYVMGSAICTGYSSKTGRGSSRLGLYAGTCAVNPYEIPYGSLLYITSPDGSFVYGYCIATDTGTALMDGIIDIDLFYESYRESALNGRKLLNVYVIYEGKDWMSSTQRTVI